MISKCKDCEDRTLGCHSICKDYLEYKKSISKINKNRKNNTTDMYLPARRKK